MLRIKVLLKSTFFVVDFCVRDVHIYSLHCLFLLSLLSITILFYLI
jgi:hypothetical protein